MLLISTCQKAEFKSRPFFKISQKLVWLEWSRASYHHMWYRNLAEGPDTGEAAEGITKVFQVRDARSLAPQLVLKQFGNTLLKLPQTQ